MHRAGSRPFAQPFVTHRQRGWLRANVVSARGAMAAQPTGVSPSYASTPGAGVAAHRPATYSARSGPRSALLSLDGMR